MKSLLLVSHAPSTNTRRIIDSMIESIEKHGLSNVKLLSVSALETTPQQVLSCDAIILFTPENLGYMSGALKDFFDRIYYPCLEAKQGLPMALVVRAGHDGTGTVNAVDKICRGLRWNNAQAPLVCQGPWQESFIEQCDELASTFAMSLDFGII